MSQNVNVNLVPGNYPKEFHVSQYDVGRQLIANIVDSTGAYSIPSGATVTLVGTKPSGFGFTLSGTVGSGGVVTFSTTATVTAEYGRIPCELRITSGSTILGTANCMLIVEESPHPEGTTDGDGEVIVNQITLLLEQITQQADRADDAKEDAEAAANEAKTSELAAEGYAVGKQNGTDVGPESPYYRNNCKWYGAQFDEALKDYAKINGYYKDMTVGTAKQLLSDSTTTDTEPYIYRQTAGDGDREEVEEVVGGTVAWNQIVNASANTSANFGVTFTKNSDGSWTLTGTPTSNNAFYNMDLQAGVNYLNVNHVYFLPKGTNYSRTIGLVLFGDTGGEHYSDRKNALFKVQGLSAQSWIRIQISSLSGTDIGTVKVYPQLFDLTAMFGTTIADAILAMETANAGAGVAWFKKLFPKSYYPYDAGSLQSSKPSAHVTTGFNQWDEEWVQGTYNGNTGALITPHNGYIACKNKIPVISGATYYLKAATGVRFEILAYDHNKSFVGHISHNIADAEFTVPSNVGYITFGNVAQGSLTTYNHDICINISDPAKNGTYEPYNGHTYPLSPIDLRGIPKWVDGKLAFDGDVYPPSGKVQRRYGLRAYQSGDESLADAITDGANTVYKLATPTTETADPYTAIQVCDPNGTEEWTDERTVQIPVGNVTKYHANLKEKLEDLPAIPSAPSANGTYTLKATVSGGAVTYQWVNG